MDVELELLGRRRSIKRDSEKRHSGKTLICAYEDNVTAADGMCKQCASSCDGTCFFFKSHFSMVDFI